MNKNIMIFGLIGAAWFLSQQNKQSVNTSIKTETPQVAQVQKWYVPTTSDISGAGSTYQTPFGGFFLTPQIGKSGTSNYFNPLTGEPLSSDQVARLSGLNSPYSGQYVVLNQIDPNNVTLGTIATKWLNEVLPATGSYDSVAGTGINAQGQGYSSAFDLSTNKSPNGLNWLGDILNTKARY